MWDIELGLVYYNWRYYDVMLGRWYCRDYIQERGGINLYSSLCNNPIRLKDYLGLQILHDVRQHARKDVKPTVELRASSAFMLVGLLLNHLYAGNGEAVFYDLKHLHIPELTYVAEADALISDGYYFMSQQKIFNKRKYTNPRTVNGKGIEESLFGDYSISASYVLYADKYRKKACRYEATIFVEDEFHVRQRSNEHDTLAIHFRNIVAATMNVIPNKSFFVKCEKKYSYDVCKDGLDFSRALN